MAHFSLFWWGLQCSVSVFRCCLGNNFRCFRGLLDYGSPNGFFSESQSSLDRPRHLPSQPRVLRLSARRSLAGAMAFSIWF